MGRPRSGIRPRQEGSEKGSRVNAKLGYKEKLLLKNLKIFSLMIFLAKIGGDEGGREGENLLLASLFASFSGVPEY